MNDNRALEELNARKGGLRDLRESLGSISCRVERQLVDAKHAGTSEDVQNLTLAAERIGEAIGFLTRIK